MNRPELDRETMNDVIWIGSRFQRWMRCGRCCRWRVPSSRWPSPPGAAYQSENACVRKLFTNTPFASFSGNLAASPSMACSRKSKVPLFFLDRAFLVAHTD
ncbi:MAG: hypothetical protein LBO79_00630 [Zoogloeaceae bacterium]|jgi:hypothetical protein|nr:hypothetical protein [Zoogloeaceae bacterium]